MKKREVLENISIFILYFFIFIRDVIRIDIPIVYLTIYCLIIISLYKNTMLIAFGISMIVFNHALQINYILITISIVLLLRNLKRIKINISLISLIFIGILELYHVLNNRMYGDSVLDYLRWLCMIIFVVISFSIKNRDNMRIITIFLYSSLFGMVDIFFQYWNYENRIIKNVINARYRFGNTYLYNNKIGYSIYDNENNIALLCIISLICAMIIYSYKKNYFFILSFSFLFFGLLTKSRTFIICILSYIFIYVLEVFKTRRIKKKVIIYSFLILNGSIFLIYKLKDQFKFILEIGNRFKNENLTGARLELFLYYFKYWISEIKIFLLGMGTQNLKLKTGIFNSPHNGFIDIAISFGVVGVVLMAIFLIASYKNIRIKKDKYSKWLILSFFIYISSLQYISVSSIFGLTLVIFISLNIKGNVRKL